MKVKTVSKEERLAKNLKGEDSPDGVLEVREEVMERRKKVARSIEKELQRVELFEDVILDDRNPTYTELVYHITLPAETDTYFKNHREHPGFKPEVNLRKVPHKIKGVLKDHRKDLTMDDYKLIDKPEPMYDKWDEYAAHDSDFYRIEVWQP